MILQVVSSMRTKGYVHVFQKMERVHRTMAHTYLGYCKLFGMAGKESAK